MPQYTDSQGNQHQLQDWPGHSHKAAVINAAYANSRFEVHTVFGSRVVFFKCEWCGAPTTSAGVQGDHIVQQRMNGANNAELQALFDEAEDEQNADGSSWNLRLSCSECNGGTRNRQGRNTRSRYRLDRARYRPY